MGYKVHLKNRDNRVCSSLGYSGFYENGSCEMHTVPGTQRAQCECLLIFILSKDKNFELLWEAGGSA